MDDLLKVVGKFDWVTPLSDLVRGFNTIELESDEASCKELKKRLDNQGIPCRVDWLGDTNYRVISKR